MYICFNGIADSTADTLTLTDKRQVQLCGFEPTVAGIKTTGR